jgi:hypothetical protein
MSIRGFSGLRPPGGGPIPQPPSPPSNVPPPATPLPDLGKVIGGIIGGNPQNGQPGTGLTGGISAGPLTDIFEDGSKTGLPGGITGGIGVGPIGTFIGSLIGDSANDGDKSAASVSGNNLLGGPDTSNALELQIRLANLKMRV